MRKSLTGLIIISLVWYCCACQTDRACYSSYKESGIKLYNEGNYRKALSSFKAAQVCNDTKEIQSWISNTLVQKNKGIIINYSIVEGISEGMIVVATRKEKYGFIDWAGREIVNPRYDFAWPFDGGLAKVELNRKLGFIDKTGREVIPLKYTSIETFSDGLAKVEIEGKYGFIDKTGKEVTPVQYTSAEGFVDGLAAVGNDTNSVFIDKTGREIIQLKHAFVESFAEGMAKVWIDGGYTFIH